MREGPLSAIIDPPRPPSRAGRSVIVGPEASCAELAPLREKLSAPEISHAGVLPKLCDFSVVKSGTSTLEAGLQGKPMCVVYRGGWASYALARLMVDIPVFSLVNIVLGRYAVPELLQSEVNAERIAAEIQRGLEDAGYIDAQRAALAELPGKLGGPGASRRAAQGILDFMAGRE
jgi:lipid A disaccharide synthetase